MGHSSDDDKETLECFKNCGADDFIQKPVYFREFKTLIEKLIEKWSFNII